MRNYADNSLSKKTDHIVFIISRGIMNYQLNSSDVLRAIGPRSLLLYILLTVLCMCDEYEII